MIETTEVASLRVPRGTVARLKMLAHKKSLEKGIDISWSAMVRECLEANLLGQESETSGSKPRKKHLSNPYGQQTQA